MDLIRGRILIVLASFLLAGGGLASSPVCAHTLAGGEFKLSQTVHWGSAVLPIGEYTYSIEVETSTTIVRVSRKGGDFTGWFMPLTSSKAQDSPSSGIVFTSRGEETFVTAVRVEELGLVLNFPALSANQEVPAADAIQEMRVKAPRDSSPVFFTILNPENQKVSPAEVERVYLSVCELIEREFNLPAPIRPQFTLRLGGKENLLHYPHREIRIVRWDKYSFAGAVVDLALHDLVSPDERLRLSKLAVNEAGATVSLCELTNCTN